PPLFDYPNHLARVHVISRWAENEAFRAHFDVASFLIPNVLSDVVLLAFLPSGDVHLAGRLLLLLTFALTLGGIYLLNRVAAGRFSVWPLFAAVFLYHEMFFWGFLNYILGLALLPWALAAWMLLERRPRPVQIGVGTAFAILIFLAHLVAFGLYAVAIAAIELRRVWLRRSLGPVASVARLAGSAAQFMPSLVLYAAVSPSRALPVQFLFDYSAWGKLSPFTRVLSSGNPVADLTALGVALAAIVLGLATGRITLHRGLALVAAAFLLLVLTLPYSALQSYFLDSRIAIAVFFMLIAAIRPTAPGPAGIGVVTLVLLLLVASRSYVLAEDWNAQSRNYAEVIAAFDRLPAGSLLVPGSARWFELGDWTATRRIRPSHEHTAGYAAIERGVIVPNLFAKPGQNPLVYAPALPEMRILGRNPILRVMSDADLRLLVDEAARVAELRTDIQPALSGVFVIVYHKRCRDWPQDLPVRPVACGADFSLMEVAANDGWTGSMLAAPAPGDG
ncbi:MAG TPA: hypothetical protein VK943_08160, partial [Arenibaculum sp.]|nr:hypothetical protein [Arenibaculum sp.]